MAQLTQGSKAPAFKLAGNDGRTHTLAEKQGGKVVLFFYPKDHTPGCTTEACDFRDNHARLVATGAAVLGVSRDSLASHDKFRDKYALNYPLLSDPDGSVHEAYGAWGEKLFYGKKIIGVIRSTFLIDEQGKVLQAWYGVKVNGHAEHVLAALRGESAPAPAKKAPAKKAPAKKAPAKKAPAKKAPAKKAPARK